MTTNALPRSSGVLMHISSLPGPFGIGDFGSAAWNFLDLLANAGQTWWQVLPLGPPAVAGCPYQCFSAMAGDTNLISPEVLLADGLIDRADMKRATLAPGPIDFAKVAFAKNTLLGSAWRCCQSGGSKKLAAHFEEFRHNERAWLGDYSLFMALKHSQDMKPWADWPRELVLRKPAALRAARAELADAISLIEFSQFIVFRQLSALRRRAAAHGVKLIGDLPIFVSNESADVWSNPGLFHLDRDRRPKVVAGVPPDYFSATGQRWGNPLYRWPAMKRDGFRWWIERARMALRQADLVRIDHFRGFDACWTIRAQDPTAERGRWVKAPGHALFAAMRREFGALPFIAEDLGVITPAVEKLRNDFNLPGMRVLQFGFGGGADNPFLPHNFVRHCIAYTGTHDNDTTVGWFRSLDKKSRRHVQQFAPDAGKDPAEALMRLAWSSVADVAIAPLQDVLSLDSGARMNTPGKCDGNWRWRVSEEMLRPARFARLKEMTEIYGRRGAK